MQFTTEGLGTCRENMSFLSVLRQFRKVVSARIIVFHLNAYLGLGARYLHFWLENDNGTSLSLYVLYSMGECTSV